ncbi:MAG: GxxExxY protein [bacterium]
MKPQVNTDKVQEFLYKELTSEILDAAFQVHNTLGCGLLEKVYENGLTWELTLREKKVVTQKEFKVFYRKKEVGLYVADMIVEEKVIVEVKSVETITDVHRAQLLNYLRISGYRIGLILNFAQPKLEYERLII